MLVDVSVWGYFKFYGGYNDFGLKVDYFYVKKYCVDVNVNIGEI